MKCLLNWFSPLLLELGSHFQYQPTRGYCSTYAPRADILSERRAGTGSSIRKEEIGWKYFSKSSNTKSQGEGFSWQIGFSSHQSPISSYW